MSKPGNLGKHGSISSRCYGELWECGNNPILLSTQPFPAYDISWYSLPSPATGGVCVVSRGSGTLIGCGGCTGIGSKLLVSNVPPTSRPWHGKTHHLKPHSSEGGHFAPAAPQQKAVSFAWNSFAMNPSPISVSSCNFLVFLLSEGKDLRAPPHFAPAFPGIMR